MQCFSGLEFGSSSFGFFKTESELRSSPLNNPQKSSPSSVKVPVLSKQHILVFPATFIRGGDMQKIFF